MANIPQVSDIPAVPIRTPMFNQAAASQFTLSRPWILFFERIAEGNLPDFDYLAMTAAAGAPSSSAQWVEEVPGGAMNGTNTIFTLSNIPIFGSLDLVLNIPQVEGVDFTVSGMTITYRVAPKTRDIANYGDYHLARYQHT